MLFGGAAGNEISDGGGRCVAAWDDVGPDGGGGGGGTIESGNGISSIFTFSACFIDSFEYQNTINILF